MPIKPGTETKLSKMQTVRKRELRRATDLLHDRISEIAGREAEPSLRTLDRVGGLREAIRLISEMRKAINVERL